MAFFISLAALALVALLLLRIKSLPSAAAPFCAVAAVALFLCATGMAGLFAAATPLIYALAALSALLLLRDSDKERRALLGRFATPAMAFFIAASAAFYLILSVKQPWFQQWDEFSFWGIAAKNVFERNELYTLFESSMLSVSYAPALPLFSCFMQRLAPQFAEWRVMAAYDVMFAASLSLLFARESFKKPLRLLAITAFGAFGLYMFWYSFLGARLFATSCADILLGVTFGGALLAWYAGCEGEGAGRYIAAALGLALLPMIKDVGLAFGLVAAVVISFDMFIGGVYSKTARPFAAAGLLAAAALSYRAWNVHYASTLSVDRTAVYYKYTALEMLAGEDAFFNETLSVMFGEELFRRQLVMFGPIIDMLVVFTAIPLVCALFCKSRRGALRLCCGSLLLLAGFFAYYFFIAYAYAAIFYRGDAAVLAAFERYISAYAIGWYLALVGLVKSEAGRWRFERARDGGALVCALFTAAVFVFSPVHPDQYLLTSPKVQLPLSERREHWRDFSQTLKQELPDDARLYLICQGSDGEEWFYLNYEAQPLWLCRTLEGGTFAPESDERGRYDAFADADEFMEYLAKYGVEYLVVERTDEYFDENFSQLFADGLATFKADGTTLYKLTETGGGARFEPLSG